MELVAGRRRDGPASRLLFAGAAGVGAGGLAYFGLALTGLIHWPVVAAITAWWLLAGGPRLARAGLAAARNAAIPVSRDRSAVLAAVVAIGFPILLLPAALAPETDPLRDSLQHNLAVAARTARLHKLAPMPGNLIFSLPPLTEMIRAAGFTIQGEGAARMPNWWATAAMGVLMGPVLSRWFGPAAGWVAAALYVTNPLVGAYAAISKADAVLAPLGFAAAVAALDWIAAGRAASAALAGFLVGTMTAVKTSAGAYLPLLAAGLIASGRHPAARRIGAAGLVAAAAATALVPFWGWQALATGNPLYPFAGSVFGWYDMTAAEWAQRLEYTRDVGLHGRYSTILDRLASPWTLSFADGFPPLWLAVWPLAAVSARRVPGLGGWLAVSVAGFAGWAAAAPKLHYLFPLLAVGAVPAAAVLAHPAAGGVARATAAGLVAFQAARSLGAAPYLEALRAGCGLEDAAEYRRRRLPVFAEACEAALARVPADSGRILLVGERQAYPLIADRRVILASSTQPFPLYAAIRASATPGGLDAGVRQLGIRWVLENEATEAYERRFQRRPWTARDVRVWAGWWLAHARLAYRSPRLDPANGWFLLYELDSAPRDTGRGAWRDALVSLPGTAGIVSAAEEAAAVGRTGEAERIMGMLEEEAGAFATVRYALGTWRLARGERAAAYRDLEAARRQGLVHPGLEESLADGALARGDLREAVRATAAMVRECPELAGIGRLRELLEALNARDRLRGIDRGDLAVVLDFAASAARRTRYAHLAELVEAVRKDYRL